MSPLMGSSGAGKTTMLDVVAQRKTIGVIGGDICINAEPLGPLFKRIAGYCEQMDVHPKEATVRELLLFTARLRQPVSVPPLEKEAEVDRVLHLLDLGPVEHAVIGNTDAGVGLSMEERKRLTIAVELVARPRILFLDEPTSGLDSLASLNIVRILRRLAAEGYALLVTIHQPSAVVFAHFDRLLLLGRGGRTIYFGPLGPDCASLLGYFARNGAAPCPPAANPAEYMLDVIGAGTAATAAVDWFATWDASPERAVVDSELAEIEAQARSHAAAHVAEAKAEADFLRTGFPGVNAQTGLVLRRMLRFYWRDPSYNVGRAVFQILVAVLIGLTFFQVDATMAGSQNRIFAIFMTSVIGVVSVNLVVPVFINHREVAIRDQSSGAYGPLSFGLAITTAELPFALVASSIFFLLYYWTYCPVSSGDNYFTNYDWSFDNRWRNALIFLGLWIFNRFVTAVLVRRFKVRR
ncbi:hypothetical protein HK405_001094 [Cladochytrium tenue]|nr:hypothetical protein HK405_001094 [Cladochytrium tenue]